MREFDIINCWGGRGGRRVGVRYKIYLFYGCIILDRYDVVENYINLTQREIATKCDVIKLEFIINNGDVS